MLPLVSQRKCNQAIWRRGVEHIHHETLSPQRFSRKSQTHFFGGPWKLWETRPVWECAEWKSPPECVQVRVIMNKAAVCFHRVVSLSKADLSPSSNLGYLACNQLRPLATLTAAAGWALCLGLLLSSPPFFHSPVEPTLKQGSPLYCPNKECHGWTSRGVFTWGDACCRPVPQKDTRVHGRIPHLEGNNTL